MALTAFEKEREARIERNRQRIAELELTQAAEQFAKCVQRPNKRARAPVARAPRQVAPRQTVDARRSGRLANQPAIEYNESNIDKADRTSRTLRQFYASSEEVYTEEHINLLGDFKEEWVLFQDGYDTNGNRIYNKETGQTCHQCRQKTLGLRTSCSECQSLKGVFCGDCLFMRYGENVKEAAQNPDWICPDCRGICNCSIHRIRKGWAPTGSLYRRALADGYKSVAHMLILTNQAKDRKQPAEPTETVQAATAACDKAAAPVAKEIETDGMQVKAVQPLKTRQEQQKTKPEGTSTANAGSKKSLTSSKKKKKETIQPAPAQEGVVKAKDKKKEAAKPQSVAQVQKEVAKELAAGVQAAVQAAHKQRPAKKSRIARKAEAVAEGRMTRARAIQACA